MNYKLHYDKLIERGKRTLIHGYRESHHIIPKCMGGTEEEDNLVWLTAEEHFTAHLLLVKIYPKEKGLIFAANIMTWDRYGKRTNNKMYGWLRKQHSKTISELKTGKPQTGKNAKGNPSPLIGSIARGKNAKGTPKDIVKCPYCTKEGGHNAMKRWHFNNCKLKETK